MDESRAGPHLRLLLSHADGAIEALAAASGALGRAGTLAFADMGFSLLAGPRKYWVMRSVRKELARARVHLDELKRLHVEARSWPDPPEPVSLAWGAVELWLAGNVGDALVDADVHNHIETTKREVDAVLAEVGRLHAKLRAIEAPP